MKVKDLITQLQCFDPEATVVGTSANFEMNNANVELKFAAQYNKGKRMKRKFTDAFDGGQYEGDVFGLMDGDEKIVVIRG